MLRTIIYCYFLLIFTFCGVFGQNSAPRVEITPEEIQPDGKLEVHLYVVGTPYTVGDFPEIKGFKKDNRTIKHSQVRLNRKKEDLHEITQFYTPEVFGKVTIPAFEILVNQKILEVEAKQVTIIKKEEPKNDKDIEIEQVDFVVELSKKKVFVGEGFMLNINFYLSDKTTSQWQFPTNIGAQVEQFAKKIKPNDCLESRLNISNLVGKKLLINGESYTVYNLFEAIYYPLNDKDVQFPSLQLLMQKQKGTSFVDMSLKTKAQTVVVEKLPEHPLKEKVPVGVFRFAEQLKDEKKQFTGNSFEYRLTVEGEGNFSGVNIPKVENNKLFDFFETNTVSRQTSGNLMGNKSVVYKIIPKEAGEFEMANYFILIYFNTALSKYDTLKSKRVVLVSGKALYDNKEVKKDIFSDIENLKTDEKSYNFREIAKVFANFVVGLMILVYLYILKSKNKG
ncbi:hypothetical protein [Lacihabitans soyangensis]|uniref:Protein BatD n=1 Tax=Lacihabitans soyangensis TaxID=869394 RepID=A0AAE3H430_9BACT|nr:hypothetical protein [Lacihabitans soyangensis]MCP9763679.1 hypothetical protein [Lacihabitans soyangensis]